MVANVQHYACSIKCLLDEGHYLIKCLWGGGLKIWKIFQSSPILQKTALTMAVTGERHSCPVSYSQILLKLDDPLDLCCAVHTSSEGEKLDSLQAQAAWLQHSNTAKPVESTSIKLNHNTVDVCKLMFVFAHNRSPS